MFLCQKSNYHCTSFPSFLTDVIRDDFCHQRTTEVRRGIYMGALANYRFQIKFKISNNGDVSKTVISLYCTTLLYNSDSAHLY